MTVFALALLAVAAPVPPETDAARMKRLFGTPVDPVGDCRFQMAGDKLTLRVGDASRETGQAREYRNAPRTGRPVRGDFAVRVRVTADLPADLTPINPVVRWSHTAGLVVWQDEHHLATVEIGRFSLSPRSPLPMRGVRSAAWRDSVGHVIGDVYARPEDAAMPARWLQITRTGERVQFAAGPDGQTWPIRDIKKAPLADELSVGVTAGHTTAAGFTATFDEFRVDSLPAEGRR